MEEIPDFYFYGQKAGKLDVDGKRFVARIVMDGMIFSNEDIAIRTMKDYFWGYLIGQGEWWCGVRFDLDDDLALQLCFNGGNRRYTYWQEVMSPKINTVLGSIYFFDVCRFEWQSWKSDVQSMVNLINFFYDFEPPEETPHQLLSCVFPYIFAANIEKCDEVPSIEYLREFLELPEYIPLFLCDVTNPHSVKQLLIDFLEYLISLY